MPPSAARVSHLVCVSASLLHPEEVSLFRNAVSVVFTDRIAKENLQSSAPACEALVTTVDSIPGVGRRWGRTPAAAVDCRMRSACMSARTGSGAKAQVRSFFDCKRTPGPHVKCMPLSEALRYIFIHLFLRGRQSFDPLPFALPRLMHAQSLLPTTAFAFLFMA